MRNLLTYCLAGAMMLGCWVWGCSDKQEPPARKSAVRQATDAVARDAVERIRTPIDRARSVARQQDGKSEELAEAAKQ
jgi:hypothetical protein